MYSELFDRLLRAMAVLGAGALVFMIVSVDLEVFLRYFLNSPTSWVVDFSEYSLLYLLFLASPWALARDAHIKIDILHIFCSRRVTRVLNIVASVIGTATCGVFFCVSVFVVWNTYETSEVLWHSVIVSKWAVWIVMPIGSFLLTIQFQRRAWSYFRDRDGNNHDQSEC